jgi:GAF domain-containing protein
MDHPSTASLAAMAYRDLDAALQLLAERAQYITGAEGAMIALRRGDHSDMLCRASAGSNAPELGALLSMEYGFSGESVRTRQALRCDDAEQDSRVNRENCRRLGISSVVAVPILSDQDVLGIFELFSGKPHAFSDDNVSALRRLSEMVETAVKYAVAAETLPATQEQAAGQKLAAPADENEVGVETELSADILSVDILESADALSATAAEGSLIEARTISEADVLFTEDEKAESPAAEPVAKKPLFWSAAMHGSENRPPAPEAIALAPVPAGLRNLHKCKACGFPVSEGRVFCVECEDKQWHGRQV